jgi:hypothetical protein
VFSDESWLCAEPWHIRFVRRYDGEELSDEFSLKVSKWKKGKKILVWAAISSEGPEALHFIHGKENSDVYLNILEDSLPSIEIL